MQAPQSMVPPGTGTGSIIVLVPVGLSCVYSTSEISTGRTGTWYLVLPVALYHGRIPTYHVRSHGAQEQKWRRQRTRARLEVPLICGACAVE